MYFANRKYFIEVIQCSGEEMNLVLMGVLPSNLINVPMSNVPFNLQVPSGQRNLDIKNTKSFIFYLFNKI